MSWLHLEDRQIGNPGGLFVKKTKVVKKQELAEKEECRAQQGMWNWTLPPTVASFLIWMEYNSTEYYSS